ncbi:MAG: glycosyltransferase [Chitinivibrionales bacterium]
MNILMMTNTYKPFIGGVERSVETFKDRYLRRGHHVYIVTPEYKGATEHEPGIFRFPAIQNFNGSDFSVKLPVPGILMKKLEEFDPDIIHSHHPFLMGDTALRVSASLNVPLVFTFHTFFERYTHYVPGDSKPLRRFVAALATGYANLSDHVIAPSESVKNILRERGVRSPMSVVPTGIDVGDFDHGDGSGFRKSLGLEEHAFVVGFVSRLAPEKNITFLCRALSRFLRQKQSAHFIIVGTGPSEKAMRMIFEEEGVQSRVHFTGLLEGQGLTDAYHAMDVFAFTSHTETQGIVIAEAMAASVPVIALDATGIREVIEDGRNGRLLFHENEDEFSEALIQVADMDTHRRREWSQQARKTADEYSIERSVDKTLHIYERVSVRDRFVNGSVKETPWQDTVRRIHAEWELLMNTARATGAAFSGNNDPKNL